MSGESWIVVRNWHKHQSRGDRDDPWIKVYKRLLHDDDWLSLTDAARGMLLTIWLEFASAGGQIRASRIPSRMRPVDVARTLDSLVHAGFIELSAAKPPRLARSREERREEEKPPTPLERGPVEDLPERRRRSPDGRRVTGYRLVRGTHGTTYVPDPAGTDRPPY